MSGLARLFPSLDRGLLLWALVCVPLVAFGREEDRRLTAAGGAGGDELGTAVGISEDGTVGIFGAPGDDDGGSRSGSAYLFNPATGAQIRKLTASDPEADDEFGKAVAVEGNRALVGAPEEDENGDATGAAYLFDTTTGAQIMKYAWVHDLSFLGTAVALSGGKALFSAPHCNCLPGIRGVAYVVDASSGGALFTLYPQGDEFQLFGESLAASDGKAIVGAPWDDEIIYHAGSAYLFDLETGDLLFRLRAPGGLVWDHFGTSVDIEGSYAVVGAPNSTGPFATGAGAVYVFDTGTGEMIWKLRAPVPAIGDRFGKTVALGDKVVVVNGRYVYDLINGQLVEELATSDGTETLPVAIQGQRILTGGASYLSDRGAGYVYDLPAAPVITQQPVDQMIASGAGASFSVTATGTGTLGYQWKRNGIAIPGATSSTHAIGSASSSDEGSYSVVVTNAGGSVESDSAALSLIFPPTITQQVQSLFASTGAPAVFNVSASGTAPLSFQWYKDGAMIPGATGQSYLIAAVQGSDEGLYRVEVSNAAGVASSSGVLSINWQAPIILQQPQSHLIVKGEGVPLWVTTTGSRPMTFQWSKDGAPIDGATESTLDLPAVTESDAGNYTVEVTNVVGRVTSGVGVITVLVPPAITQQPVTRRILLGRSVVLSVEASGTGPFFYQWQLEGVDIPGANTKDLTLEMTQTSDAGRYTVIVNNGAGQVTSENAYLSFAYFPDAKVGKRANALKGNNIYNLSGSGQTQQLVSSRGKRVKGYVSVENDGPGGDHFFIKGGTGNRYFAAKYFSQVAAQRKNVTASVKRGDLLPVENDPDIPAGAFLLLVAEIQPSKGKLKRQATGRTIWLKKRGIFKVIANSWQDQGNRDAAVIKVRSR